MAKGSSSVRRAQLLSPFGVGAIMVTPEGTSMLAAGLDHWFANGGVPDGLVDVEEFRIEEWRLERLLDVSHLRMPPDFRSPSRFSSEPNQGLVVPFVRFPTWHRCSSCKLLTQEAASSKGHRFCPRCQGGLDGKPKARRRLIQVSNVAICQAGHMQDFPYVEWVHRSIAPAHHGPLRLFATGAATAANEKIRCDSCGAERTLAGVLRGNAEGSHLSKNLDSHEDDYLCSGQMPWHGPSHAVTCGNQLRGALRGASNVYFPLIVSSIYLPRGSETDAPADLIELLDQPPASTLLHTVLQLGGAPTPDMLRRSAFAAFSRFTDAQIVAAIDVLAAAPDPSRGTVEDPTSEVDFRREEFEVLLEPRDESQLVIRKPGEGAYDAPAAGLFSDIRLVERLRETRALWGFNRVLAESSHGYADRRRLLWRDLPDESEVWLPAYSVFGEGIFLRFDEELLTTWERHPSVVDRIERLHRHYDVMAAERGIRPIEVSPRLVLVHTLSHLLINALAHSAGYAAASLRERLYVSTDERPMAGVLIYTADGDSEGTLGGLVRLGRPGWLEPVLGQALEQAAWCSGDPVCMEIGGSSGQGPDSCNLAACYRCSLVAETSCERGNRFLDRALLTGTTDQADLGLLALEVARVLPASMVTSNEASATPVVSDHVRQGRDGVATVGEPWDEAELGAAVDAYEEMLRFEMQGVPYVKARIRERYLSGPLHGRSKRSFEERMGNISAVRRDMGLQTISGYKPKEHVGQTRTSQIKALIRNRANG